MDEYLHIGVSKQLATFVELVHEFVAEQWPGRADLELETLFRSRRQLNGDFSVGALDVWQSDEPNP